MATGASSRWTAADIPDQSSRVAVVTGANSGLGLETARQLAVAGAHVVLACRSAERGEAARRELLASRADASLSVEPLDLASLDSVRDFAKRLSQAHSRLDLLVNNAGVMALPRRQTADGFEMQLGTNHLGHFALTGLLLPKLLAAPDARVVTVSSTMHRFGRMRWDDLHAERSYQRWLAYAQSKLANLLFAFELASRLEARGARCVSTAAHPGYAATGLQLQGARMERSSWREAGWELINRVFSQSAAMGALPTLYAATARAVQSGGYYGPDGIGEARGHPRPSQPSAAARNPDDALCLWELSEAATGVRPFEAAS